MQNRYFINKVAFIPQTVASRYFSTPWENEDDLLLQRNKHDKEPTSQFVINITFLFYFNKMFLTEIKWSNSLRIKTKTSQVTISIHRGFHEQMKGLGQIHL